ncbi:hypothetical protein HYS00_01430 [Candidatus Microgenomates bacterium]|nr:hypothetical protein [Candidatus Microgenomates bacterium]
MEQNAPVIRSFDTNKPAPIHETMQGFSTPVTIVIFILAVILGTGLGYTIAGPSSGGTALSPSKMMGIKSPGKSAGVKDDKKFPDKAEGTLKEGGIDGEGNFHLERPGGDSQNVYLTSSIVDLSEYVGKKVRVHGQTFEGKKAGWLMDVGYVEIL